MSVVGQCPKCKNNNLTYLDNHFSDDYLGYDYECDDCKALGTEWYELNFVESVVLGEDNE